MCTQDISSALLAATEVLALSFSVGRNRGGTSVFQCYEGFVGNCGVGERLPRAFYVLCGLQETEADLARSMHAKDKQPT